MGRHTCYDERFSGRRAYYWPRRGPEAGLYAIRLVSLHRRLKSFTVARRKQP